MRKILIPIVFGFLSIIGIMKLLILLNKPNIVLNVIAISGIILIGYIITITRFFTKRPKLW